MRNDWTKSDTKIDRWQWVCHSRDIEQTLRRVFFYFNFHRIFNSLLFRFLFIIICCDRKCNGLPRQLTKQPSTVAAFYIFKFIFLSFVRSIVSFIRRCSLSAPCFFVMRANIENPSCMTNNAKIIYKMDKRPTSMWRQIKCENRTKKHVSISIFSFNFSSSISLNQWKIMIKIVQNHRKAQNRRRFSCLTNFDFDYELIDRLKIRNSSVQTRKMIFIERKKCCIQSKHIEMAWNKKISGNFPHFTFRTNIFFASLNLFIWRIFFRVFPFVNQKIHSRSTARKKATKYKKTVEMKRKIFMSANVIVRRLDFVARGDHFFRENKFFLSSIRLSQRRRLRLLFENIFVAFLFFSVTEVFCMFVIVIVLGSNERKKKNDNLIVSILAPNFFFFFEWKF